MLPDEILMRQNRGENARNRGSPKQKRRENTREERLTNIAMMPLTGCWPAAVPGARFRRPSIAVVAPLAGRLNSVPQLQPSPLFPGSLRVLPHFP